MKARVLVVDDNVTNLDLMAYLLRAFGYECTALPDAATALERARTGYDIALVDILMPGMDGYEFARRFRADATLAATPLVAVTALAMPGDEEHIRKAGFDGYIAKPIDPERFVTQVEAHLKTRPSASALAATSSARAVSAAASPQEIGIVLAVDDRQSNLDLIRLSLAPSGYRVAEARSIGEAMSVVRRMPPSLILCDLHMPPETGFTLLEKLREREEWCSIPFVFLSSKPWEPKDRERGMALGVRKFLARPIDPEDLRSHIDECLHRGDDSHRG